MILSIPVSITAPPQDPPSEETKDSGASESGAPDTGASDSGSSDEKGSSDGEKKRHWLRWLIILAAMLLVVGIAAGGTAYYLARRAVADIPTVDLSRGTLASPAKGNEIQNFLIIGSDSRMDVDPSYGGSKIGGERSDTIMIAQLDPRRDKGVVVSIPRDTRVEIPGHGTDKINAAYAEGGVQLAVDTVKAFTGLPIHHYIEINFEGFSEVVDALGGVDICVDQPIRDQMTGLDLRSAGCHHLTGEFALAYARSREPLVYEDGKWRAETSGDFGRIQRQQTFMKALMKRAISVNAVGRWKDLSKAVSKGVRIDAGLDFDQFMALYGRFSDMTPEKVEMLSVPGEAETIKGVSYVIAKEPDTSNLFHSLGSSREDESVGGGSIDITSTTVSQVQVKILNGTATMGLAAEAANRLKQKGFFVAGTGDTRQMNATEIRYEKGNESKANAVKQALGVGHLIESKQPLEADVIIYLGKDYRQ